MHPNIIKKYDFQIYSRDLNTKHWNTERFEVLFSNGPKTRWPPFCSVFHWKIKLLAGLDHFIYEHNKFSSYIKWSRMAKSSVFQ